MNVRSLASRPLALALLTALLLAASATGLWRLFDRRHALQDRTQTNLEEAVAAAEVHALVTQQGDAVRDLVLATTPDEIRDAERRFEALSRRGVDAQAALLARFAADPETTADERALLSKVTREQLAAVQPVERVVSLARLNEDAAATRVLVEEALPHQAGLREALATLGALQAAQNRALQRGSDTRSLEMALMVILGGLVALLAATLQRVASRASSTPFATPAFGLGHGRAACNDEPRRHRRTGAVHAIDRPRGEASLGVSAAERARALQGGRTGGEVVEEVDAPSA